MVDRQGRPEAEVPRAPWEMSISDEQWEIYRCVLIEAGTNGPGFALGGAFALATHTGRLRNTKDLDIYVLPAERHRMMDVLTRCGLQDYYSRLPYDRGWIYRGARDDTIVDVIWGMPNRRAEVDEQWLTRGPRLQIRGSVLSMLPAEELIWCKLYVMQRQRCDWPDVLNLLYFTAEKLDWRHLMERVGDDTPLLAGVLSLFFWLCPERAQLVPSWLCKDVGVQRRGGQGCGCSAHLLDTRPWFGPEMPCLTEE